MYPILTFYDNLQFLGVFKVYFLYEVVCFIFLWRNESLNKVK
jgi:hypothetical protein